MATFNGQLNTNVVFASLFNAIISLQTFPTGVDVSEEIYGSRKVDGTLYGDTKLYNSTDILRTYKWHGDSGPGYDVLTQKKPPLPKQNKIVMDVYRQIPITIDEYLSKQAFQDEGSFIQFNATLLAWLQATKKIYEHTTYLSNMMVSATSESKEFLTIDLKAPTGITGYDALKWQSQELFRRLEDQIEILREPSREWNDNGFIRTAKLEDFDIVIPVGVLSNVRKHDIPFLFNPDSKVHIKQVHWKYFGTLISSNKTADGTERALVEKSYTVSSVETNVLAGELIPSGAAILAGEAYQPQYTSMPTIEDGVEIYLIHKDDYPIMSAFSVGTSFFNAVTLKTNHYVTFGHNDVYDAHIGEFPLLKVELSVA